MKILIALTAVLSLSANADTCWICSSPERVQQAALVANENGKIERLIYYNGDAAINMRVTSSLGSALSLHSVVEGDSLNPEYGSLGAIINLSTQATRLPSQFSAILGVGYSSNVGSSRVEHTLMCEKCKE